MSDGKGEVKLYKFSVPRAKLAVMPDWERNLFIMLGHIANELEILRRLIVWSQNHDEQREIPRRFYTAQTMCIGRILTGRLSEMWELLHKCYFNKASKEYDP